MIPRGNVTAWRSVALRANLEAKVVDRQFRQDVRPLLAPGVPFDVDTAAAWVRTELLPRLDERAPSVRL